MKQSLEKRRLGEHAAALDLLCSRYVEPVADSDAAAAASGDATTFKLQRVKEIIDDLIASSANSDEALAQG